MLSFKKRKLDIHTIAVETRMQNQAQYFDEEGFDDLDTQHKESGTCPQMSLRKTPRSGKAPLSGKVSG